LTEQAPPPPGPGPLHPATRLGRVLQQIRSFTTLHAAELEGIVGELEAAGQTELATRLRTYRALHTQEAGLILDELVDVRAELEQEIRGDAAVKPEPSEPPSAGSPPSPVDPAASSPKHARWLAEQARRGERPVLRRELFLRPKE
jgi:hypothetical protein